MNGMWFCLTVSCEGHDVGEMSAEARSRMLSRSRSDESGSMTDSSMTDDGTTNDWVASHCDDSSLRFERRLRSAADESVAGPLFWGKHVRGGDRVGGERGGLAPWVQRLLAAASALALTAACTGEASGPTPGGGAGGSFSQQVGGAGAGPLGGASGAAAAQCAAPLRDCSGACVDVMTSTEHCGVCGESCASGATCTLGQCSCPAGLQACDAACVDPMTSSEHCGSCGNACSDGEVCTGGTCACAEGFESCADGCVDTQSSDDNCGACGSACGLGEVCVAGECNCAPESALCDGQCTDVQVDADNCGACGNPCGEGQACADGACVCEAGLTACGEACVDTTSSAAHCGACDQACGEAEACVEGVCSSGAPGEDGCAGLARGIQFSDIRLYQTIRVDLARGGQEVTERDTLIVAGRETLVRGLFEVDPGFEARELSARLLLSHEGDLERIYSRVPIQVRADSNQDDRRTAFEFLVPAEAMKADTHFALEIVECGGEPTIETTARFPDTGALDLHVTDTGTLKLRLLAFDVGGRRPDINDAMLEAFRAGFMASYPIGGIEITVDEQPLVVNTLDWNTMLEDVAYKRSDDNAPDDVYYYGLLTPEDSFADYCSFSGCVGGVGYIPTNGVFWDPSARAAIGLGFAHESTVSTALHEVGHNHGRLHAPCLVTDGVDPDYPQDGAHNGGQLGVEGWDVRLDGLIPPTFTDIMGYCQDTWFSDYTYHGISDTLLMVNGVTPAQRVIGVADDARFGDFLPIHIDADGNSRWGKHVFHGPIGGEAVSAVVYSSTGEAVETITVFERLVSDIGTRTVFVPLAHAGWAYVALADAAPIAF